MLQRHEGTTSSGRRDLKRDVSGDRIAITYESLLVIIPALNEERTIERVVTQTRDCSDQLAELGLRLQICVIDDGSRDETAVAARRAGVDDVIIHKLNRGCGAAVRSGAAARSQSRRGDRGEAGCGRSARSGGHSGIDSSDPGGSGGCGLWQPLSAFKLSDVVCSPRG